MDLVATITANAQSRAMDVTGIGSVVAHCFGTFAGINCAFEASVDSPDGIAGNWFGIQAVRSNANTAEATTSSLSAAPAYAWEFSVAAYKYIRVRSTAYGSGTQTWVFRGHEGASESLPFIPALSVSGTITNTPATPSNYTLSSAATTNATAVKGSAGTIYGILVSNTSGSVRFLKIYDKATAPTVGTDIPKATIQVPATGFAVVDPGELGLRCAAGIGIATTAAAPYTDTAAVAANDLQIWMSYI